MPARAGSSSLRPIASFVELAVYAVLAVAVIVAVAAFAPRLGVAAPIVLVLVGVALSFLPGLPLVEVPHELILDGALPPILYAAALSLPLADFRRNVLPIASLAVILVLDHRLRHRLRAVRAAARSWRWRRRSRSARCISPPDAVAATSIGRRLGLPPRLLTVLEGEGLVNDATALVLLRSATAAAAGHPADARRRSVRDLVLATVIGIAIGLAGGFVTMAARTRLDDPVLDTAVSLAVPFVAFVPAQFFHASGVLAVVTAGLYASHAPPPALSPQARISDRLNWRTIQFLLENGVFLLIGLELRSLVARRRSGGPRLRPDDRRRRSPPPSRSWASGCSGWCRSCCALRARAAIAERVLLRQWLAFHHSRRARRGRLATRYWRRAERATRAAAPTSRSCAATASLRAAAWCSAGRGCAGS